MNDNSRFYSSVSPRAQKDHVKLYAFLPLGVPSENAHIICWAKRLSTMEESPGQKEKNIQQAGFPDGHPL
jgi:hypothetical protein